MPVCPRCGDSDVMRTHRRWFERLFSLAVLPWRCRQCGLRFYALAGNKKAAITEAMSTCARGASAQNFDGIKGSPEPKFCREPLLVPEISDLPARCDKSPQSTP